jgi:hypothetical protein
MDGDSGGGGDGPPPIPEAVPQPPADADGSQNDPGGGQQDEPAQEYEAMDVNSDLDKDEDLEGDVSQRKGESSRLARRTEDHLCNLLGVQF